MALAERDFVGVADDLNADITRVAADEHTPSVNAVKDADYDLDIDAASPKTMRSEAQATVRSLAQSEHIEQFLKYTGMTPDRCYFLVLASLILRVMGGCWVAMVALEYTRYYVINDLGQVDVLRTLTGSPQYLMQAFLFPFLGVVSDRVSRKKIILASSLCTCLSAWLLTTMPSVEIYVATKALALIADVGSPIRDAMLRDIFSAEEWENSQGGVTGLRAKMAVIGQVGFGIAMLVGMCIMKMDQMGLGIELHNEYTWHKKECDEHYCLTPGRFSWDGGWAIDGSLRLLMLLASVVLSLDVALVLFAFPETIRPELRTSMRELVTQHWRELAPWTNMRVFATKELRMLMSIRCLGYFLAAGGGSIFMSFYARFEFDTFTMMTHTVLAGSATWFLTLAVPKIVERFGDVRGVWIPSVLISLIYGFSCALMPAGYGYLVYVTWPLLAGPSFALNGFAPDLMAKLIPGEVQGTFQTAKSFVMRLSMAVFMWPWNQLFVHTKNLSYPFDATCVWVSIAIGFVMLLLVLRLLRHDPRDTIRQGKALEAFMASSYAQSAWYLKHSKSGEIEVADVGNNFTTAKHMQQLDIMHAATKLHMTRSTNMDPEPQGDVEAANKERTNADTVSL
eukprot:TRINITY_DN29321_c0_g1_i1.p1 TRINITY_DN29321_c0_g1~~TRINITY_DN29321_c0_g1_i1.p1  ORF type:complete len:622 (-),score=89.70 TRINITY_DN29321_c0_g1_i1:154-2019(-)